MDVTILGNNSALPAFGRHPTAQAVNLDGEILLLDCGEGTQIQMQQFGIRWRKVQHIFISHLHGDHYFGLPGLLNSMSLLGRASPLYLHAPKALETIIQDILKVADTRLSYEYNFNPLPENETSMLVDNKLYSVFAFPVEHRIGCHGFLITKKTKGRKILPEKCSEYDIPAYFFERLKRGEDYQRKDGFIVENEWVTEAGPKEKKYAYCADTIYTESFIGHIQGTNTIYHECTYLDADSAKATARFHSTAKQAASIALKAGAHQLLLGHFSSKYRELDEFKTEAETIFPNVIVTREGETYHVD